MATAPSRSPSGELTRAGRAALCGGPAEARSHAPARRADRLHHPALPARPARPVHRLDHHLRRHAGPGRSGSRDPGSRCDARGGQGLARAAAPQRLGLPAVLDLADRSPARRRGHVVRGPGAGQHADQRPHRQFGFPRLLRRGHLDPGRHRAGRLRRAQARPRLRQRELAGHAAVRGDAGVRDRAVADRALRHHGLPRHPPLDHPDRAGRAALGRHGGDGAADCSPRARGHALRGADHRARR